MPEPGGKRRRDARAAWPTRTSSDPDVAAQERRPWRWRKLADASQELPQCGDLLDGGQVPEPPGGSVFVGNGNSHNHGVRVTEAKKEHENPPARRVPPGRGTARATSASNARPAFNRRSRPCAPEQVAEPQLRGPAIEVALVEAAAAVGRLDPAQQHIGRGRPGHRPPHRAARPGHGRARELVREGEPARGREAAQEFDLSARTRGCVSSIDARAAEQRRARDGRRPQRFVISSTPGMLVAVTSVNRPRCSSLVVSDG